MMNSKNKNKALVYILSVAIALGVGLLSSLLTRGNMDIYGELNTPPLSPPSILFPIVWTVLYVLMGISAAMVYLNSGDDYFAAKRGLTYYAISLFFNFAWSIVFFNLRWFLFAFIWLIILFWLIVRTIKCYKEVSPLAAKLQIPYAIWVAFAGYLNLGIYLLNK